MLNFALDISIKQVPPRWKTKRAMEGEGEGGELVKERRMDDNIIYTLI